MLRRWRAAWPRRGKFLQVPPANPVIPGIIERSGSRPRWAVLRRGRFWGIPAVFAAPRAPQGPGRATRRLPSVRRGDRFDPPWSQVTQAPSVWSPPTIQAARRLAGRPARRGRFIEPPWPQITPTPPAFVPRLLATHRPQPGTPRRARFPGVPPGQGQPAAFVGARRRNVGARPRRGRLFEPPWPQVIIQPSVWRPAPVVARRRPPTLPRIHGRRFDPPWPQAVQAAVDMRRWEGAGTSQDLHDATAGQTATHDAAGAVLTVHEGDDTMTADREGTSGTSTMWEGG